MQALLQKLLMSREGLIFGGSFHGKAGSYSGEGSHMRKSLYLEESGRGVVFAINNDGYTQIGKYFIRLERENSGIIFQENPVTSSSKNPGVHL